MPAVQKQPPLPLSKAAALAWQSVRIRLARSILTLITIAMSIAFLSFIWLTRAAPAAADAAASAAPGRTGRTLWLLALSLLVCLVGITNAMLMSVMERFREIGTMKCLGALDSFILKLFFLESVFLGAGGSIVGTLLGLALGYVQLHVGNRSATVPGTLGILVATGSITIGLAITAAAALYPAYRAARMDPIAAMRVEV